MGDLGFWALAHEDPDHLALVAPDGTELSAGELLGRANQVVHALRGFGLKAGDVVATVLPNCTEMIEIYLAALQAGWYLVPINHHLVASEIAYILADSEAKVFIGHERFADVCVDAADEAEIPGTTCLAVGEILGFNSYARLRDAQPTTTPEGRTIGDVMNYTSGTTGTPRASTVRCRGPPPRRPRSAWAGSSSSSGSTPRTTTSTSSGRPSTTPPSCASAAAPSTSATPWSSWTSGSRGDAGPDREAQGHHLAHGADPVPPAARPPRGDQEPLRPVVAAPHDPCRRTLPGRRQAQDDRVVGAGHRRVLRGQRGRGHRRQHPRVAGQAGDGRPGLAHLGDRHLRRRGQPGGRTRGHRHRLHGHADRGLRVPQGRGQDQEEPDRQVLHRGRRRATSTRTATCSSATARST